MLILLYFDINGNFIKCFVLLSFHVIFGLYILYIYGLEIIPHMYKAIQMNYSFAWNNNFRCK